MPSRMDAIPFVGRRQELAALLRCLGVVAGGQGRLALLTGEPGIGKTRLLAVFTDRATAAGWQVLAGRAYDLEGMPPYFPFSEALREYVRIAPPADLRARLEEAGPAVVLLAPDLRRRLSDLPAVSEVAADEQRYALFESVSAFLLGIARQTEARGLVVVLDDLHWADTPSLLLLQHLGRRLHGVPLLVAGAYRSVEVDRSHPLTNLLAALRREEVLELLPLGALSADECAALIETASGRAPAPSVAAALYRATEGHPLFLAELVRHLQAEGRDLGDPAAALEDWQVPQRLRAVIDVRLARLSGEANRLLQAAAVLGDGARFNVLSEVCGVEPLPLLDALDEALAAGLLREEGEAYGFSHALIRQAILDELSLPRRQRLHRLAAEAIETLYAPNLEAQLGALALHYRLAGPSAAAQALAYARRAGAAAMAVYAWEEAVQHWQAALGLLGPAEALQRCELLLVVGEAQQRAGAGAAAQDAFRQASALARGLGAGELLARAALGFAGAWPAIETSDAASIVLLEQAVAALGAGDSALRCRILARLAAELSFTGAVARADAVSAEAVAAARRLGDARALADTLSARHAALSGPEWLEERLANATEVVQLAETPDDKELLALGRRWRLTDLLELGDLATADRELAAFTALAGELRQPLLLFRAALWRAMRTVLAGRFDEAEDLAFDILRLEKEIQGLPSSLAFAVHRWVVRRQRGIQDERDLLEVRAAVAQHPFPHATRWWLARLALDLGGRAEAQQELDTFAADGFASFPQNYTRLPGLAVLAEVCAELGDRRHAATLYQLLRPFAARPVMGGGGAEANGAAAYYLGLLATTLERWQEAEEHFQAAEAMHRRLEARAFLALTWFAHGRMLLARGVPGDCERAVELVVQARTLAEELGMARLAEVAAELSLTPTRSERGRGNERILPDGLTAREAEILRLIAGGLTSKQIAATLVLAVPTVRRHVANLYGKIGAHGRADATVYALAHGLGPAAASR